MVNKIVVSGGWSYGNLGDEAIAKCTMTLVENTWPEACAVYCSYNPSDFFNNHNKKSVESIHSILEQKDFSLSDIPKYIEEPDSNGVKEFFDLFDDNSLFIMAGGGYFVGSWTKQFAARILEIELAKKAGAKVCIVGQSIGPFVSEEEVELVKHAFDLCDYINVRDSHSQYLINQVLPTKQIKVTCDSAIIISDICKKNESTKKIVNFVTQIYDDYFDNSNAKVRSRLNKAIFNRLTLRMFRYNRAWINLVKRVCNSGKYECRFLLNVKETEKVSNQHYVRYAKWLTKKIGSDKIYIVCSSNVDEFCDRLSEADAIVSCKMHPLIVSASYGIPTYAVSQYFKVDAFMQFINRDKYVTKNSVFNSKKIAELLLNEGNWEGKSVIKEKKEEVYKVFAELKNI